MRKFIAIAGAGIAALSLSACGASTDEAAPAPTVTVTAEPAPTATATAEPASMLDLCPTLSDDEVARIVESDPGTEPNYTGAGKFVLAGTARLDTENEIFTELWFLHSKDGRTYSFATDPNGMLVGADGKTRKAWVWGSALGAGPSPARDAINEAVDTADDECVFEWDAA